MRPSPERAAAEHPSWALIDADLCQLDVKLRQLLLRRRQRLRLRLAPVRLLLLLPPPPLLL
jgi:hypothetical protein